MRRRVVAGPVGPVALYESADVDRDLDEAIASGGPPPYGRVLWTSASCVAHALASLPLRGLRVLELGCGTGLVSLAAAQLGATVTATDIDSVALEATACAAAELDDAVAASLRAQLFDIRSADPLPSADLVIAADLLYEELLAAALARRVLEARRAGAMVIVGDPGRVARPAFARLLAEHGVSVQIERIALDGASADVMTIGSLARRDGA